MNSLLISIFYYYYAMWGDPYAFLHVLLRTSLLLAVALLVVHFWRSPRPDVRILIHRAALLGTLGLFLLTLVPSVLPDLTQWKIPLYAAPAVDSSKAKPMRSITPVSPNPKTTMPQANVAATIDSPRSDFSSSDSSHRATPQIAPASYLPETTRDKWTRIFIDLLRAIWPLLSVGLLLRLIWCHFKIALMKRRAQPIEDNQTLELLRAACLAIGVKVPRLLTSPQAHGPFLCGIFRPSIVLPPDYEAQFDRDSLRAIFLHEASHIRNRDCLWTYLRQITCALLWLQPLLWLLSRKMESASEEACDLAVLEGGCAPRDYARCLLDLAEHLCLTKTERAVGVGVIPSRSSLANRVEAVLQGVPNNARRLTLQARWLTAAGTLCLGAFCASFAVDAQVPIGATGSLRGRVIYADGRPAGGLGLVAAIQSSEESRIKGDASNRYGRASRMLARNVRTTSDGTYTIDGLLAGAKFNLMVHNGLWVQQIEAGPPGWVAAAQTARPQSGRTTKVKDIVLTRGALIQGRIEDATTGQPLANMSVGCYGPHRPLSTGSITNATSDANGRFVLRVPPGKNWVYWNGPTESIRAEVHFGSSTPYEKELSVVKRGNITYGQSDFVEVRVDGGQPRYSRSGNGGVGRANEVEVKAGQTRQVTFRLTPLRIEERAGQVPLVKMSDKPPVSSKVHNSKVASHLSLSAIDLEYAPRISGYPQRNALFVHTQLSYGASRPLWWSNSEDYPKPILSFVSGYIEDSKHRHIPVSLLTEFGLTKSHKSRKQRLESIQTRVMVTIQGRYDLSRGGKLTLRMAARERINVERFATKPYWEGETSVILPPAPMKVF